MTAPVLEWEVTGDIRDLQFEDVVKIPVLELEGVRAENIEFHMRHKYNGGEMLDHFVQQARGGFLTGTNYDGAFHSAGGCAAFGLGMLKWRTMLIPEGENKAAHVEALLDALRAAMRGAVEHV